MKQTAAMLLLALCFLGCDAAEQIAVQLNTPPEAEVPVANLPLPMRQHNWLSPSRSGSCANASTISALRWAGQIETANRWRQIYSGGETAKSLTDKWKAMGVPYCSTYDERRYECSGDPAFLQWVSDTRRMAVVWYYPRHAVSFVGFSEIDGVKHAFLLDNNREDSFIPIEYNKFIREWRGYGGFAIAPVLAPTGPLPWPIILPIQDSQ